MSAEGGKPGGLTDEHPVNEKVEGYARQVKDEAQAKAGSPFTSYTPVSFRSQVVAGTNYFIKVDVGQGQFIVERVYVDFKGNTSLSSVKTGVGKDDSIEYF